MSRTTVVRTIKAPIELVFETVAKIEMFSEAVPDVVEVVFLSESKSGVGTRYRETRTMGRRTASTDLEVIEYVPYKHARMVADQGGTVWDTVFAVQENGDGSVELRVVMEAKAYKRTAKLMNPLVANFVRWAIEKDMDAVKSSCESSASKTP